MYFRMSTLSFSLFIVCTTVILPTSFSFPTTRQFQRDPRQIRVKPDGTIVASFSAANAFDAPGFDNSFAMSQTFEIGPRGSSSSGSTAFSSDVMGNSMSFANANAQNSRNDMFGGGGGFSAANAAANSFSNPMFSGGNSQANSFGSGFGLGGGGFGGK